MRTVKWWERVFDYILALGFTCLVAWVLAEIVRQMVESIGQ